MVKDKEPQAGAEFQSELARSAAENVTRLVQALFAIDITIDQWSKQLRRAQPLIHGRIGVLFSQRSRVMRNGVSRYDRTPSLGKMIRMKSGGWRFVALTPEDAYTRLSDLRVGRSLPGDAIVVRLLDGLQDLFLERKKLVDLVSPLRDGIPGKILALSAYCQRKSDESYWIASRIKLDWHADAEGAKAAIRAKNRATYEARKAKKAQSLLFAEPSSKVSR